MANEESLPVDVGVIVDPPIIEIVHKRYSSGSLEGETLGVKFKIGEELYGRWTRIGVDEHPINALVRVAMALESSHEKGSWSILETIGEVRRNGGEKEVDPEGSKA